MNLGSLAVGAVWTVAATAATARALGLSRHPALEPPLLDHRGTPRCCRRLVTPPSTAIHSMLPHSLELALEEADVGFQDEQLLRRANVSPFFSSRKAPSLDVPSLELGCSRVANGIQSLGLDLCDENVGRETKRFSLSCVSSWHDLELDANSSAGSARHTSIDPFASVDMPVEGAWEMVLAGTTPNGLPVVYPLTTPTADDTYYSSFFPEAPAVLSPTHTDKKVLVTDRDLQLVSAGQLSRRHVQQSARSRLKREVLFPQGEAAPSASSRLAHLSEYKCTIHRYRCHPLTPSRRERSQQPRALAVRPSPSLPPTTLRRLSELSSPTSHQASVGLPQHNHLFLRTTERALFTREPATSKLAESPFLVRERRLHYEYERLFRPEPSSTTMTMLRSMMTQPPPPPRRSSRPGRRRIGIYTPEARRERLRRFHEKRKQRVFHKRVKYDCRKRLANACPRVKGRFVRKQDVAQPQQVS